MNLHPVFMALIPCVLLCGCTTYHVPGGRADLSGITSSSIQESFAAAPAAQLPAGVAFVRLQAPRYTNYHTERMGGIHGQGRYTIITVREVEDQSDFDRLAGLPGMGGLIGLSTLLLPERLDSDRELREAAARLKADMLVLYTFDTAFHENDSAVIASAITLGLSPTRNVSVNVNASALVMDTRTGFIYSAIECSERRQLVSNVWQSRETADNARQDAERAAFKKLIGEFEQAWPIIAARTGQGA